MTLRPIRPIAQLRTPEVFQAALDQLGISQPAGQAPRLLSWLPDGAREGLFFDAELVSGSASPFAQPVTLPDGFRVGNRLCIHPMEGWDAASDGNPTELVRRRWVHFGQSGAKLIWGGEAAAVRPDGRANPNQLMITRHTLPALADLRRQLVAAHIERHGSADDLLVGLQLTHSGRFARPNDKKRLEPVILYHHPVLDARFGISPTAPVFSDEGVEELIRVFIEAAVMAQDAGFQFVDLKHCHGYLGHEFLSAVTRPGPFGGSFENRTRFLGEIVAGIRRRALGLGIGVRISAFDFPAFQPDPETRIGRPVQTAGYPFLFGASPTDPLVVDLAEPVRFLELLRTLGISLVNLTAGSPYYCPHIQRPALFPPSDGYLPPEDPLVGVARQVSAAAALKQLFPDLLITGTGYSYLQEWLPNVAQYNLRTGRVDFIGLGRLVLCYPDYPADLLAGRPIQRKQLCRSFSDCTTAPRGGLVSGCYPLDPFYKVRPEAKVLDEMKKTH